MTHCAALNNAHCKMGDFHGFKELPLPQRPWVEIPAEQRIQRVRIGRSKQTITLPEKVRSPFVVNYGMGTDSTALLVLLVEMFKAGNLDARPDLIIFANVGSEKANTYAFIEHANAYLRANNFPEVTIVSKGERGASKDLSLHESCLRLETMPSLAYGGKSCSLKWKAAEMDLFLSSWEPAIQARAAGLPVIKAIGYDASPADLRRSSNPGDRETSFFYPLRDAGLQRPELMAIINAAGLPQPGKSACFCCPAMKKAEVTELAALYPEQAATALRIEAKALFRTFREGRPMTTVGLGRNWAWRELLAPETLALLEMTYDTGSREWNLYQEGRSTMALSA